MDTETAYEEFLSIVKKGYTLYHIEEALGWDEEVIMTPGGANHRAEQKSVIASLTHQTLTSKRLGELLEILKDEPLDEDQRVNVVDVKREYDRQTRISPKLVEQMAKAKSQAFHAWRIAREKKDFSLFVPALSKVVELTKQVGKQIGPTDSIYENLIQEYEPHINYATIKKEFAVIKAALIPLIKRLADKGHPEAPFLDKDIPKIIQKRFNKFVSEKIGFDFTNGRLDITTHPFTSHPADVRITTRYSDGWWGALSATIHESGHGMYEQGLSNDHYGTPRGLEAFTSIHESQSRFWENNIALNEPFWKYMYPFMQLSYPPVKDVSREEFIRAINRVEPNFIRISSDEITYALHIILRTEIEESLMSGEITVEELPKVWNTKMQEYLGITPPNDALGVLQDVHWAYGFFGYFPTYLLGTMMATQLYIAVEAASPNLNESIEKGEFSSILQWLRKYIHEPGRKYSTQELIKRATGNEPRSDEFLAYLEKKYSKVYGI